MLFLGEINREACNIGISLPPQNVMRWYRPWELFQIKMNGGRVDETLLIHGVGDTECPLRFHLPLF